MSAAGATVAIVDDPLEFARLRDLFEIVDGLDATDVLVDDQPVPYARELWLPLVWFLIT